MSGMTGSTGVMVKVKMRATFQETRSAAIKEGCMVTIFLTRSRVIGAGRGVSHRG
jgi:hypothetical protein